MSGFHMLVVRGGNVFALPVGGVKKVVPIFPTGLLATH